jgi:hypothetical protein
MGYIEDLKEYTNKDGFVGPTPCAGSGMMCDNHALFTAEAFWTSTHNSTPIASLAILGALYTLVDNNGIIRKYPGELGYDLSPDNWIAISSLPIKTEDVLEHMWLFDGFADITGTWPAFMYRQLHLLYLQLIVAKSISNYNPLRYLLEIYSALVILTAGIKASIDDLDNRKLTYVLIRGVRHKSFLCRLAEKVWWKRLKSQYGPDGMREVYKRYFGVNHPLAKYAKNAWEL